MPSVPGFINGSAPSQSRTATSERTMNLFVEKVNTEGPQHKTILLPTPGFQAFAGASAGITDFRGRAGIAINGRTFVIIGAGLYELFQDGTVIRRGTVAQNSNPAQIVSNGTTGGQLGIASGGNAYCYTLATNVLTQVLTAECDQIAMLDGYFLAFNMTNGKLRLSNLNDGLTWDPTQFALRSAQPDMWAAMHVNAPDIWLLGGQTGDIWYDAGTSPFPLAARQGLAIPFGIAAAFSLSFSGGTGCWVGQNKDGAGVVVQSQGYAVEPISTPELATALAVFQRTATINDAFSILYQQDGHTFYIPTFPTAKSTWAYDLTTGVWAERGRWNPAANDYDIWGPQFHVYSFGKHLIGDALTGTIATMDATIAAEVDGSVIRRLRRGPVLIRENQRLSIRRFELVLETGLGLVSGQGSDPLVMLRISEDGGHTWGSERLCSAGAMGQFSTRVFWTRCGSPRQGVFEISMTDPIPFRIIDALINNDADANAQAA